MNRLERALKENPSFSSSLLEKIYRSIDEGDAEREDLKFYRETMQRKESRGSGRSRGGEEEMSNFQRACLVEKWMEKKVSAKANAERKQILTEFERKPRRGGGGYDRHDRDQDAVFFSSTSSSTDSSSGDFSSSDTESMYGAKSRRLCFAPSRPKPVRTSVSARGEKQPRTGKTERTLSYEQRELHMFDDYHHYNSATDNTRKFDENLIKSKSRAMKIYGNLKKVKQPISPGGRLANFINSLFATGNAKKPKSSPSIVSCDEERKAKSGQVSTCSSASSFSRSCLSKNSPGTRERLRNGVKRTVRFYPVSVIVDEDCRPCGHKNLYEEEEEEESSRSMAVSVPTAWKIGRSPTKKTADDELKFHVMEKSRRVEEMAREFLKEYHQNQKKNELIQRETGFNYEDDEDEDDHDDDAASCSSSDLFELDHLTVIGKDLYRQELPVYETTHISTNRAIANGLMMQP
ncbi:hypothetical protein SLA2020_007390 [Shorea laevis]